MSLELYARMPRAMCRVCDKANSVLYVVNQLPTTIRDIIPEDGDQQKACLDCISAQIKSTQNELQCICSARAGLKILYSP
eukprot:gene21855-1259_t